MPPSPESFAKPDLADGYNFAANLLEINLARAGRTAYVDDYGSLSYGQLDEQVRRMAGLLAGLGLRQEERVLLLMHDTSHWPVAFLGCLYAGVVPVAVNTLLTADDYAYMLHHSRARAALVSAELLPVLDEAIGRRGAGAAGNQLAHLVVSHADEATGNGRAPGAPTSSIVSLDDALASHEPLAKAVASHGDDPAFWLYSSGSTGRPKGTVHTHANLWWTAELFGKPVLGLTEEDVCFSAAKLYFAYGLGNALTFPLSVGASVVLMSERPTPDAVFRRWTERKPTVFFGAPTGFAGMLASPRLPPREAVALRMCSTEMLHVYVSNRPGDVRYGTTGRPVDGYEIELRGEDGRPVAAGEVGDLYVKGPSAALMYWSNRDKSRETFQGAWTRSGDKYTCDADGYYTYAGRSDDMLKVSGIYVSPFEVEATLMQHPAVLESAVIGKEDQDGLTKTKAYVVLKDGMQATTEELQAFVKQRLAPYKYPRFVEFVEELPKTATGKIQRFRLRERERERDLAAREAQR